MSQWMGYINLLLVVYNVELLYIVSYEVLLPIIITVYINSNCGCTILKRL